MSMIKGYFSVPDEKATQFVENPEVLLDWMEDEGMEECYLDIDKAWHGLHYLFTGTAWEGDGPLANLILAGHPVGDDIGYGPPMILTPEEVQEAAEAISEVDVSQLASRFKPQDMAELKIYPEIWIEEGDDALQYLLHFFEPLKSFFASASKDGHCVIHFLT